MDCLVGWQVPSWVDISKDWTINVLIRARGSILRPSRTDRRKQKSGCDLSLVDLDWGRVRNDLHCKTASSSSE